MNKKGFLLGETVVKIIIAVICIAFLVYFLTALYFSKVNNENKEVARNNLDTGDGSLKITINLVRSDGTPREHYLQRPSGWYLFSFTGQEKPNSCAVEKQS